MDELNLFHNILNKFVYKMFEKDVKDYREDYAKFAGQVSLPMDQFLPGKIMEVDHMGQTPMIHSGSLPIMSTSTFAPMFSDRPINHFGQVKYFRQKFKEYSKEEFRTISNEPLVKEMLTGAINIPIEDRVERIRLHLENNKE